MRTCWLVVAALVMSSCGGAHDVGSKGIERPPVVASAELAESFDDLGSAEVLAAALRYPTERAASKPPLSLTDSDGSGLVLTSLEAEAVVEGPLAFTQLSLRFHNPEAREREGRFRITLPASAAVSRLAMRINERWQEAEVVERQKARAAYEDFLHHKQDPALLEKSAGNEVSARIYPIDAEADKDLVLSYSQEITDGVYRLPLRGLPAIAKLRMHVRVLQPDGSHGELAFERQKERPRDFEIAVPDRIRALMAPGDSARTIVRVTAPGRDAQRGGERWALLVDTSASRAPGFARYAARVHALVSALARTGGADAPLIVAAFDQRVAPLYEGTLGDMPPSVVESLLARRPLGASNLEAALGWLNSQSGYDHAVLIGDAVATAGDADRARVRTRRLDVVLAGGIRDEAMARRLATSDEPGVVLDLESAPAELARRLCSATSNLEVEVAGADWWWPRRLDGVQAGDTRLVAIEGKGPLVLSLGQARVAIRPLAATPALVDRAITRARIESLEQQRAHASEEVRERLRQDIVSLSTRGRVLSEHTALLVLETEDDYRRFGIQRSALTDILAIGPSGIEAVRRDAPVLGPGGGNIPPIEDRTPITEEPMPEEGYGYEFSDDPVAPPSTSFQLRGPLSGAPAVRRLDVGRDERVRMDVSDSVAQVDPEALRADPSDSLPPREIRVAPYSGRLARIMTLLDRGERDRAMVEALDWRNRDPGDVMALLALGEALEARGQLSLAARAYGSIIDLFPDRADMRRFAGARLDRLGRSGAKLAIETYRAAVAQRPDHPTGHRMLAYALLRSGAHQEAFTVLERALERRWPEQRRGVRVLLDDLGLVAAAWLARAPSKRSDIERRLKKRGARLATTPSTRFVLSWETDANDVDLHVIDGRGDHAYYRQLQLPSGGALNEDVTVGYGPESFTISGRPTAYPYELVVHYYARGPMGYGLGKVEVVEHDGKGGLRFRQLPFVVMNDMAYVELGTLNGPLQ